MHTIVCMNVCCNKLITDPHPVYRIFLDNQLIVERRFWPKTPDYYIQEQLTLSNTATEHTVKVKNVSKDRGEIFLHNVAFFNGNDRSLLDIEPRFNTETEFTFVLPKR